MSSQLDRFAVSVALDWQKMREKPGMIYRFKCYDSNFNGGFLVKEKSLEKNIKMNRRK
jgi:hypothetical protein